MSSETWRSLLVAADAFGTLAPWTWMHDSELLGLRYPATGEEFLCSILGRLRQVFGLLVFRRETGRRWILRTILDSEDPDVWKDPDSGMEQDCLKVEFTVKSELTKPDRAILAEASTTPTTKRGCVWPVFRSLVPGGYPWYPSQAEAETLLWALPRVNAFARLCRDTPGLGVDLATGEVPFLPPDFDPTQRQLRQDDLDWRPMIPPPEPPPEPVSLDEETLARLLKLEQAKGFHLEMDMAYSVFAIADGNRPRFPRLALAVDRASGFVGGFHLASAEDHHGAAALATVLRNTLQQLGSRPETIHVQRPRLAAMLANVSQQLGIPVIQDAELRELNSARESMERRFGH